jgi:hypothetical protein
MKKLLLYSSLLVLSSSLCKAQDTLVLRNGQKMVVKIISVGNRISYSIPPDDRQMSVGLSKVRRIKYGDGTGFTNNDDHRNNNHSREDTIKLKPYIVFSGGFADPWTFSGYGASSYYSSYDGYGYSGYAINGFVVSVMGGISLSNSGWELTGSVAYIRNEFNASGIMSETIANFGQWGNFGVYGDDEDFVNPIGTYYYTNTLIMAGVTKNWGKRKAHFSLSFLVGDMITYMPAMKGIIQLSSNYTATTPYYFEMNSLMQNNGIFQLGINEEYDITKKIFIRGSLEFELSGLDNHGGFQYTDMNGNVVHSGNYNDYSTVPWGYSNFFVGLTNLTAGIGFKF